MDEKYYICIDLKCFYASVECAELGLDPFRDNLVVADSSRGHGSICLAISPHMKELGVKNRCRLYEIPEGITYKAVRPRMKTYMQYSANIYEIYLKYVSHEDIHVYSIDECFIDATSYLKLYDKTPKEFAKMLMKAVLDETGICATAGIGTNLFLAKVALDITAKHSDDFIGYLDEESFKEKIWHHRPITDIWNIGRGIAKRLEFYGVYDLYGVSRMMKNTLYREFGVNAEFLIDHAIGYEPCTIADIKSYRAKSNSISNGQILFENYDMDDAFLIVKEMLENLVLELVEKNMMTNSISLYIGYSKGTSPTTGGVRKLSCYTDSYKELVKEFGILYMEKTKDCPIRKINVGLNNIIDKDMVNYQFNLFEDKKYSEKERKAQIAIINIKNKYGKNALLRAHSLKDKSTAIKRNETIGGHHE